MERRSLLSARFPVTGWLEFLPTVVILSLSGVLAPGPLFVASISRAMKGKKTIGMQCAIGHTIVELPLVIALSVGLAPVLNNGMALRLVGFVGGIVLLVFAVLQFQAARKQMNASMLVERQSGMLGKLRISGPLFGVVIGIIFTGLNPFFLLWWATVGLNLVGGALMLGGFGGLMVMYASHVWMDYAWLGGTASYASRRPLSLGKWYRGLLLVFSAAMITFGVEFIVSSVS